MPKNAREKMLEMLKLNKRDVFYDVGCGNGQLLLEASPLVKKAIGIEIDPVRFLISRSRTRKMRNIRIIRGNLFRQNLSSATKMAVFLSPETNARLGEKIRKNAKAASYKWPIPGMKLIKHDAKNRIYLYGR